MFLEIKGIKKSFGAGESHVDVLKGIDLEIEKGEFCVLLGTSGSGKFPNQLSGGQQQRTAIDRMYADNNSLKVGDTLIRGEKSWKITGLVALSDYSALFQNNNASMFDSVKFGVAIVTPEEFENLDQEKLRYNYAWIYDHQPKNEKAEKKVSENLMGDIGKVVALEAFVPRYLNQTIIFTGDDMGGDRAMVITLLYIVIVIMAFVFGITISNTIQKEAGVIGTLRASGYTRRELILHYMTLPVLVTLAGALIGNVLGYTVFKGVCADMYYGSYSLPTYVTVWNADAFLLTTVVPVIIMILIDHAVLRYRLQLSPLKLLRRDFFGKKQKRAVYLSPKIGISSRFRLRVIFQNVSSYLVLFVGVVFANLLLFFGMLLPSALDHYQLEIQENMLAKYQYMLSAPASAYSGNKADAMSSLMEYYMDTRTDNKDEYSFKVDGIYDYAASLCVFMERDKLNEAFDLGDDYFGGYFSDTSKKCPFDFHDQDPGLYKW